MSIDEKPERLLRISQIIGDKKADIKPIIPVSRSHWWMGVADGRYPKPIKLSRGITVWRESDIRALIEQAG